MARRQYGSGSVSLHSDGWWVGRIEAGWTPQGTRRRIVVKDRTEKGCKAKLRAKQREIATQGSAAPRQSLTVKSWSEIWLDLHTREVRPRTYANDQSCVRQWIVPTIGHKRLNRLTPGDVRAVLDPIRQAGRSDATVTRARAVLLGMLRRAAEERHLVPPEVLDVRDRRPADRRKRTRQAIPTADAHAVLNAATAAHGGVRFAVALLQGLRPAEARGLTWDAIDLDRGLITVDWQLQSLPYLDKHDRSKGFRVPDQHDARHLVLAYHLVRPKSLAGERTLPLLPEVAEALRRWRDVAPQNPWGLVFTTTNLRGEVMPVRDELDRRQWRDLLKRAGIDDLYDLYEARHTMATVLLEAGVDPLIVAAIMGHTKVDTTRIYQHARVEHTRAELSRAVAGLIAPALPAAG